MSELELTWPPDAEPTGKRHLLTQNVDGKDLLEVQQLVQQLQDFHQEVQQQNEELLRAQHEAQEARARYEDLYNQAPLGYVTLDSQGIIQQLNHRAGQYFKTEADHLLGRRFLVFVLASYRETFWAFFQRILSTDTSHTLKVQLEAHDGSVFDARLDGLSVTDPDGQRSCRLAVAEITALQQAIRQRQAYQRTLERALQASQTGMWDWSFASNELRWDARAQACFGRPFAPNPVPFSVLTQAVHPDDLPSLQRALQTCVQHGTPLDLTHRVVWPDGSLHYVAAFGHVQYDAAHRRPECLSGLMRDVTEMHHLQEAATQTQLRQQREVLQAVLRAQEEERRRISEALHNGVGQLLFAAKLALEHQLQHPTEPDKVVAMLNEAIRATRNTSFELTPIVLEDFGLDTALRKLVQHLPTQRLQVHLNLTGLSQPRPYLLDLAVYRIVQELLNNVIRHAHTGEATVHVVHEDSEVYLSVEDNGVGFDASLLNAAPRSLGVATIRNRVALFGGQMELVSRPGRGTIVSITLPVQAEFPEGPQPQGPPPAPASEPAA